MLNLKFKILSLFLQVHKHFIQVLAIFQDNVKMIFILFLNFSYFLWTFSNFLFTIWYNVHILLDFTQTYTIAYLEIICWKFCFDFCPIFINFEFKIPNLLLIWEYFKVFVRLEELVQVHFEFFLVLFWSRRVFDYFCVKLISLWHLLESVYYWGRGNTFYLDIFSNYWELFANLFSKLILILAIFEIADLIKKLFNQNISIWSYKHSLFILI